MKDTNPKPMNPRMKRAEDRICRVLDWITATIVAVAVALMVWGFFFKAA